MSSTGQYQPAGFPSSAAQNPTHNPWGSSTFCGVPFWHPDGLSRPLCIALTILGFAFWWPIGLAVLAFGLASGRFGCGRRRRWMAQNAQGNNPYNSPAPAPWNQWKSQWGSWCAPGATTRPSGNHAFDEYKTQTLQRLEEEQREFGAFLERLRFARDKQEFDQFMAERRQTPRPPAAPEEPNPA